MKILPLVAGLILTVTMLSPLSAQIVVNPLPPVETDSGKIAGQVLASGVKAWLGVPYAKPPVDDLRWREAEPIHWDGVYDADRYGPECPQPYRSHLLSQYFSHETMSENCLFLNIWAAPDATPASRLPVIVYIHGGGTSVGSGGMAQYNGENLARHGAVMVTINYRLRSLGWLAHPELTKEQGGHSGDYTYLDMIAALKWVHDNIGKFGGDPAHLTVMGQSYGGTAVFELLMSPKASGLFTSAVIDSACPNPGGSVHFFCGYHETTLADGEKAGEALQAALGAKDLADLRNLGADKILANPARLGPVIDGYFKPAPFAELARAHRFNDVPMLFTSNADDMDWGNSPFALVKTAADYKDTVEKLYGANAAEFLKLYPVKSDADVSDVTHRIVHDMGMQEDARDCARMFKRFGGKSDTFVALFTHHEPIAPGVYYPDRSDYPALPNVDFAQKGAVHNFDPAYWFGAYEAFNTLRHTRDFTDADRAMSAEMSDILIAFARTGNPSTDKVTLAPLSPGHEERLILDHQIRVEKLPVKAMDWLAAHPIKDEAPACYVP